MNICWPSSQFGECVIVIVVLNVMSFCEFLLNFFNGKPPKEWLSITQMLAIARIANHWSNLFKSVSIITGTKIRRSSNPKRRVGMCAYVCVCVRDVLCLYLLFLCKNHGGNDLTQSHVTSTIIRSERATVLNHPNIRP